jgi:hypothetical protein
VISGCICILVLLVWTRAGPRRLRHAAFAMSAAGGQTFRPLAIPCRIEGAMERPAAGFPAAVARFPRHRAC